MSLSNLVVKPHISGFVDYIDRASLYLCLVYSMNQIKKELTTLLPPSSLSSSLPFEYIYINTGIKTTVSKEGAVSTRQNEVCRLTQLAQSFVSMLTFQAHAVFSPSNGKFA